MANPRLKEKFYKEIIPVLKEKLQFKTEMQVPRIEKVTINKGIGTAVADKKLIDAGINELSLITGQKAVPTVAKKSISNFKLRQGMQIGVKVTLHGDKMFEFMDRLISIVLPRVRDFKGLSVKGFDGRGNYTLGIKEQIIFPEISIDKVNRITGMNITIVTSTNDDNESLELLKEMGMPFAN